MDDRNWHGSNVLALLQVFSSKEDCFVPNDEVSMICLFFKVNIIKLWLLLFVNPQRIYQSKNCNKEFIVSWLLCFILHESVLRFLCIYVTTVQSKNLSEMNKELCLHGNGVITVLDSMKTPPTSKMYHYGNPSVCYTDSKREQIKYQNADTGDE